MTYIINICILFYLLILMNIHITDQKHNVMCLYGHTMGTIWKIKFINDQKLKFNYLMKKIQTQLNFDNHQISSWNNTSDISNFNNNFTTKPQKINNVLSKLISMSLLIGHKTHNLLDITSGTLINLWGFGPKHSINKIPSLSEIKTAKLTSGYKHIKIIKKKNTNYLQKDIPQLQINLSSIGEGFAADNLAEILNREKITNYTVLVGGAIRTHTPCCNSKPKIIAIQKPEELGHQIHMFVSLKNNGISTSGTYRNYYLINKKNIIHLIDPITGNPSNTNLISVSVISKSALESDLWDTGLMLLGFQQAKNIAISEKLAVCLIKREASHLFTWISPQFKKFLINQPT